LSPDTPSTELANGTGVSRRSRWLWLGVVLLIALTLGSMALAWTWPQATLMHYWLVAQATPVLYWLLIFLFDRWAPASRHDA
jgi:hypothetical protein